MAATNIPIIVQGNSFNLAIPLQIYVIQDNEMVLQDYTPLTTDDVSIQLKGCRRNYTYTPTIEGNVAKVYLTGNELADNYSIVVSIVKANGERLRSFRTDQFFIVESSDDLTQADIIEGLEDNVIYLQPQYFIAGEDGRGIISVTKTATSGLVDTYTITYTDNTTSTFQVTNGALQPVIVDIEGDVTNAPDEEDLTSVNNGNHDVLKFNDKAYMPTIASGLGRKYLRKNMVGGVNKLTQAMFRDSGNNDLENTIFHIQYDYDLDGATITMPANSALKIDGGKINNGKIVFQNTSIESDKECFGENLEIEGKVLQEANPDWFVGSDADKIEKAITTFSVVKLSARDYLIDRQIEVHHSFKLSGSSFGDYFGEGAGATGIRRDMSSTRLKATDAFNATATESYTPAIIKACRGDVNNRYYSIHIENVSFVGNAKVGYGLEICTPNGPSRPVSIIGCNFKYFDHAIDINNDGIEGTSSAPSSTNVGVFALHYSNVTNNNYGLYVSGNHALMLADIKNNNLEANSYGAIYALDESLRPNGTYTVPIFGSINIENNLLEAQPNPISILAHAGVNIVGNYFERRDEEIVYIKGYSYGNLINVNIRGNVCTSDNLRLKLINVNVSCDQNDYYLELERCLYTGKSPKRLAKAVNAYFTEDPSTTSNFVKFGGLYPQKNTILESGGYQKYVGALNYVSLIGPGTQELTAGRYRLMTKIINSSTNNALGIRINEYPVTSESKVVESISALPKTNKAVYCINDIVLDDDITAIFRLGYRATGGALYMGDFVVVKLNDNPYLIPQLPKDNKNIDWHNITNQIVGDSLYDTTLNKNVTWEGKTSVGTSLISQVVAGQSGMHIANTCEEDKMYRLTVSVNVSNTKQFIFRKAEDSTDGQIIILNTASKDIVKDFTAPSPTIYPYIYLYNARSTGANQTFNVSNLSKVYVESDGATAGVKRNGTTAQRPASGDIYVGFQYWDTDLGKMIAWNGSAWVNLDGTALT